MFYRNAFGHRPRLIVEIESLYFIRPFLAYASEKADYSPWKNESELSFAHLA